MHENLGQFSGTLAIEERRYWHGHLVGGYPPGGMSTVYAWEQWFQSARIPCQLFFSGYPEESVENLLRDRAISDALGKDFDLEAVKQWLRLLMP